MYGEENFALMYVSQIW